MPRPAPTAQRPAGSGVTVSPSCFLFLLQTTRGQILQEYRKIKKVNGAGRHLGTSSSWPWPPPAAGRGGWALQVPPASALLWDPCQGHGQNALGSEAQPPACGGETPRLSWVGCAPRQQAGWESHTRDTRPPPPRPTPTTARRSTAVSTCTASWPTSSGSSPSTTSGSCRPGPDPDPRHLRLWGPGPEAGVRG